MSTSEESPGATPLYKKYRYMQPHWVGFLRLFGLETGIRSYTLCPFWSGISFGFRGNYGSVSMYLSLQFQMSMKKRERREFKMDLKNCFACALIEVMII